MSASGRGSGKRDFSEHRAKLEKHVERLPDYAQRAQEKLQKYFPPSESGTDSNDGDAARAGGTRPGASKPADPPQRGSWWLSQVNQASQGLPVVADAQARWAEWQAPAAKLQRRTRRASRAMAFWIIVCLVLATVAGLGFAGLLSGVAGPNNITSGAVLSVLGAVVAGSLGVRSGLRLRELKRTELPAEKVPKPLPAPGSAARAPMERLAEAEEALAELLKQLSMPVTGASSSVPEVSVEDARKTADEAAAALKGIGARIEAIERAYSAAPAHEQGALKGAVSTLSAQLDDGLEGYGSLVAAAGRAVAASSDGARPAKDSLTDATDRLAGLAIALRELS